MCSSQSDKQKDFNLMFWTHCILVIILILKFLWYPKLAGCVTWGIVITLYITPHETFSIIRKLQQQPRICWLWPNSKSVCICVGSFSFRYFLESVKVIGNKRNHCRSVQTYFQELCSKQGNIVLKYSVWHFCNMTLIWFLFF